MGFGDEQAGDSRWARQLPMQNSASRSCWENTSNATIVCVRLMPLISANLWVTTFADLLGVAHPQDRHEVPLAR